MPKPLAQAAGMRLGSHNDVDSPNTSLTGQLEWERHLDAGRIGTGSGMTFEQLCRLARNERVLLGKRSRLLR